MEMKQRIGRFLLRLSYKFLSLGVNYQKSFPAPFIRASDGRLWSDFDTWPAALGVFTRGSGKAVFVWNLRFDEIENLRDELTVVLSKLEADYGGKFQDRRATNGHPLAGR